MLVDPAGHQKPTMDRIILIACTVLLVINLYSEVVLATPKYESSIDSNKGKEDDGQQRSLVFSPRMGRRKRNLKDDGYKPSQQELTELWDVLEGTPLAVVTMDGKDKFICRDLQGKRDPEFVPRLGRNLEELSANEKWLRDALSAEIDERSSLFAPRLGRKAAQLPGARSGREA